jgi:hypothetical protein
MMISFGLNRPVTWSTKKTCEKGGEKDTEQSVAGEGFEIGR